MSVDLVSLTKKVDAERMMNRLAQLARYVKLSGTGEERQSLETLASDLSELGYSVRILEHEAFISLPISARLTSDGREIACITHSMGASVEQLFGELVYVGCGTTEDFAKFDLTGKVALIDGIALEDTTLLANRSGAVAQIHISPNERLYEMCVSPVWGSPDHQTVRDLPGTAVITVSHAEGVRLRDACENGGTVEVEIETQVDTGWRQTPILVAEMACEHDAPYVLLSGHHDTWHHGVMDNGAANVTMLECARLLAERRANWARGLRLCFWSGHSHGRYSGSTWYADTYWRDLAERCLAHVNVDSTGGSSATLLTRSGVSAQLAGLVAEAVAAESGQVHEGRRQGRAADQSFWGIGIASALGSISHEPESESGRPVALGPFWHTPDDLIEHVDAHHLARDTRVVLHVLARLLVEAVPPIDHQRWCADLRSELEVLESAIKAGAASTDPDFAPIRAQLQQLEKALAGADTADVLRRIGHHLIPLDHTSGDRFGPDPALPRAPWPVLEPLRSLAGSTEDQSPFARVAARRALNRLEHALRMARREIEDASNSTPRENTP